MDLEIDFDKIPKIEKKSISIQKQSDLRKFDSLRERDIRNQNIEMDINFDQNESLSRIGFFASRTKYDKNSESDNQGRDFSSLLKFKQKRFTNFKVWNKSKNYLNNNIMFN